MPFGFPAPAPEAAPAPASPAASPGGAGSGSSARRRRSKGGGGGGGGGASPGALPPTPPRAPPRTPLPAVVLGGGAVRRRRETGSSGTAPEWGYLATPVLPHVALWAALAVPALLCMHVQVATRFLCSACPALYWFAAHVGCTRPALGRAIWAWFLAYASIGTVLFVNFFPWT